MECALINKKTNFVDDGSDIEKENAADKFARNRLISETDYQIFVAEWDRINQEVCCIAKCYALYCNWTIAKGKKT